MVPYWHYSLGATIASFAILGYISFLRWCCRQKEVREREEEDERARQGLRRFYKEAVFAIAECEDGDRRKRLTSWKAPFSRLEIEDALRALGEGERFRVTLYNDEDVEITTERFRIHREPKPLNSISDCRSQPLYDTITLNRASPNGFYRAFTDIAGKCELDIAPDCGSGGQLYAPRAFEIAGLDVLMKPVPKKVAWDNERRCDIYEELEPRWIAEDRQRLASHTWMRLKIGVADYWTGTLAMMPYALERKITIPPQQGYFMEFTLSDCPPLHFNWKLTAQLKGTMGYMQDAPTYGPSY